MIDSKTFAEEHAVCKLTNTLSADFIDRVIYEAKAAARVAAEAYLNDNFNGRDQGACGFAWVNLYEFGGVKIKGNTKAGKLLKAAGVEQDYTRAFSIWNPSSVGVQSIDVLTAGARAAANVFCRYGFKAYAGSRLD
jgi:hypothetical protein